MCMSCVCVGVCVGVRVCAGACVYRCVCRRVSMCSSCICCFVKDRTDGVLETQLYISETKPESFRAYSIVAENVVGRSLGEATLIQSKYANE